ncbi:Na+/H+ antiporter NhaC family protein [Pontibacter cellulosilyticus]|uniref:Na+/H+ antiporter NhaC family protein n=1 Tax=Pontibacter cellulosilyticus TaxID=1720253 RepID=A0A923SK12_9BACT|nr:Na+/H+ antiporter NhaC family protein [Pontibacter cellulosilyticus]MBC5994252.1 Na+/H+ antiporter NhaC family protein [Pontibacter cellulosilyticus]
MKFLKSFFTLTFLLLLTLSIQAQVTTNGKAAIEELKLHAINDTAYTISTTNEVGNQVKYSGPLSLRINGELQEVSFTEGEANFSLAEEAKLVQVTANIGTRTIARLYRPADDTTQGMTEIPMWLSILPPLIAIVLALIFREVLLALFAGIWIGGFVVYGLSAKSIFTGLLAVGDTYLMEALTDGDHVSVIIFSMLIGGMVAIISKNGGMAGVVNVLSRYAQSAKSSQLVTWFLGIAIFFDDYANTLIVGNTMRPVTDKHRISREKLAYLVDSTAAPVAAIAFVTTWIGAELGYIKDAATALGIQEGAYSLFFHSLEYAYYPVLTLVFMLMLILMNRDYGAMHHAETRARETGAVTAASLDRRGQEKQQQEMSEFEPIDESRSRSVNALLPVLVVIFGTIAGLLYTGYNAEVWNDTTLGFMRKLSITIGDSNSYRALIWASLGGVLTAVILSVSQRIMSLTETMESLLVGFKTMLPAILILVLAWSLAAVTQELYTAEYLTSLFSGNISPYFLPEITFFLAAVIAFSTGSSWGTMAILYPLMMPAAWYVSQAQGLSVEETMPIIYNVISVVLAGAVFGDHCSPISDTTILSSLASGCNHIDHVKTQLPYAITVALVANLVCTNLSSWGVHWLLVYAIGAAILWGLIRLIGKKNLTGTEAEPVQHQAAQANLEV